MQIQVHPDGHYFQQGGGEPFFYLADTAWMLFNKLTETEARRLFADRSAKGFTAVQAVVFRDLFEPNSPNVAGLRPFASEGDLRAARLNPKWIEWVVHLVGVAGEYGLVMALLPTWGDKWNAHSNSAGPVVMNADSGHAYCRGLSDALGECANVIWILGGDSPVRTQRDADVVRAMGQGLRAGASGDRLISFHPTGRATSEIFHSEGWLDFNALQTGHARPNLPNHHHIERLYHACPTKPCLDMECNYEMMPAGFIRNQGLQPELSGAYSAYDVRKAYYRSVLAGGAGFAYGCEPIRQVYRKGDRVHAWSGEGMCTWDEALSAPGSSQLRLLKDVLGERSYFTREPAQQLLRSIRGVGEWADHTDVGLTFARQENTDPVARIAVARCREGRYILVYLPVRQILQVDTSDLAGDRLDVTVYNPETREVAARLDSANSGTFHYLPERDLDSFLVIDAKDPG